MLQYINNTNKTQNIAQIRFDDLNPINGHPGLRGKMVLPAVARHRLNAEDVPAVFHVQ
jgi:hypothetical protein